MIHGDECQHHRDRNRDDGHQRRRDVPEEEEYDERDDYHLHDELFFKRVDRPEDEVRAVVHRNELHALREGRIHLLDLLLYAFDDVESVLLMTDNDDPAYRVAHAIVIGHAASELRPHSDRGHAPQKDRRSARGGLYGHARELVRALHIAPGAHHELAAAEFNEPSSRLVVVVSDCLHHLH
ncbi:MAG: hypothetical protein BWY96_02710 [Spirochaetes bacterium ADurb.BinA120]|nr:MAG: hypothetical protein BWY96_02710 [Spirochaetes bacterium ADurb.BinA120]